MADNPNGKITKVEMEMMIDELREHAPVRKELAKAEAEYLFAKFCALQEEGFSVEYALRICIEQSSLPGGGGSS